MEGIGEIAVCWAFAHGPPPLRRVVSYWVARRDPALVEVILPIVLRDGGERARLAALELVASLRQPSHARWAVAALQDASPQVRAAAAHLLGSCRWVPAGMQLEQALLDERPEVRASAVWALGYLPTTAHGSALAASLTDPDPGVRDGAARALGRVGIEPALGPLQVMANRDRHRWLRRTAQDAIAAVRERTAPSEEKRERVRSDLIRVMLDERRSLEERERARQCLIRIGGACLPALLDRALRRTNNVTAHLWIVEILASLPASRELQMSLIELLSHVSVPVRRLAMASLGRVGDQGAIFYLSQVSLEGKRQEGLLNQEDARVARAAIDSIQMRVGTG